MKCGWCGNEMTREATRREAFQWLTEQSAKRSLTVADIPDLLAAYAAHRSAADRQEIERLRTDAENMLWNLGGISTVALGCFKEGESFDKAAARPALLETMELRKRYDANRAELEKLRGLLRECESAMGGIESFVRFYMEREQNAPANSQEACREAREEEAAFNKALRAIRRALSGEDRDTKSGEASEKNISR